MVYIFFPLPVGKIWAYMDRFYCLNSGLSANLLIQAQTIPQNPKCALFFIDNKLCLLKIYKFWIWLRFLRYGFFTILKYVKAPKTVGKQILIFLGEFIIFISNIHLCLMCVLIFEVFGWHVIALLTIFKFYTFAKL